MAPSIVADTLTIPCTCILPALSHSSHTISSAGPPRTKEKRHPMRAGRAQTRAQPTFSRHKIPSTSNALSPAVDRACFSLGASLLCVVVLREYQHGTCPLLLKRADGSSQRCDCKSPTNEQNSSSIKVRRLVCKVLFPLPLSPSVSLSLRLAQIWIIIQRSGRATNEPVHLQTHTAQTHGQIPFERRRLFWRPFEITLYIPLFLTYCAVLSLSCLLDRPRGGVNMHLSSFDLLDIHFFPPLHFLLLHPNLQTLHPSTSKERSNKGRHVPSSLRVR